MAYVPQMDEEQNKPNAANGGAALPTTGGGGGGAPSGNSAQPAAQGGNQGFASLNQYLGANKDQAPGVANTVASNLGNQYTTLQGNVDSAANQASEAIKGGSTAYDPNLVNSAISNPSQFVADPNNLAAWQKQYSAAYTGPTAFESSEGYGKAADAGNKAQQTYQLGQTGGGYTQLLNQVEKNPTAGKTALDKSLIQYDPNAAGTVQTALNPFKNLQDYLAGKSAEIGQQAAGAATSTADTAKKTQDAATGAESNFESALGKKLEDTKTANQKEYQDMQANLKGLTVNNGVDTLSKYGLSPDQAAVFTNLSKNGVAGTSYGPTDLSKYATAADPNLVNPYNVASSDDYANSQALSQLGGAQTPYLPASNSGQAGTAPKTAFDAKRATNEFGPALNAGQQGVARDQYKRFQDILNTIA